MSDPVDDADANAGDDRELAVAPVLGLFGLFSLTILGGVALADPFQSAGVQTFEDPSKVSNVGLIFVEILVFTAVFIAIVRYDIGKWALRALITGIFGYATGIALFGSLSGVPGITYLAGGFTVLTWVALWAHPEWYVIDVVAVVAGAAIIAQLGNGLGPLPVLLFLVGMAIYDAYAVYVSEHMQQLGSGVGELKLPMVYVVPNSLSFSMDDLGDLFEEDESEESENESEESADVQRPILLGLGDAIVPGLLAVSAGQFLDPDPLLEGTVLNLPALGAVLGSLVGLGGLLVLIYFVERAHAGLPVLNASVIAGYLAGALLAGVPLSAALGL